MRGDPRTIFSFRGRAPGVDRAALVRNQFVLTLRIDADRLNAIDRNRFVVDPIDLLLSEQLQGFRDSNRLVGVIGPVSVAELGDDIGVIGNGQKRLYLLLIPRRQPNHFELLKGPFQPRVHARAQLEGAVVISEQHPLDIVKEDRLRPWEVSGSWLTLECLLCLRSRRKPARRALRWEPLRRLLVHQLIVERALRTSSVENKQSKQ